MENETKQQGGLGRAFIAIGLLIILASLFFGSAWIGVMLGIILIVVGLAAGGRVQT